MSAVLPVAVFAYNEEELITGCLTSILAAGEGRPLRIYVLINGCTDRTEAVVRRFAETRTQVVPVTLPIGDKANAWNAFVHEIAPEAESYIFIDGDMQIVPGSIAAVERCFVAHPGALAVAAVPSSGRTIGSFRTMIVQERVVAGNFYALSGRFVRDVRAKQVRLPIGMFGEDGLVGTLVRWNLDPKSEPDFTRIEPCPDAQWQFDSFSPLRPKHWRLYKNRMMRYATRRLQARMLYPRLWKDGLAGMPKDVMTLYREEFAKCRLEWNGFDTIFDLVAFRRIRRRLAARG